MFKNLVRSIGVEIECGIQNSDYQKLLGQYEDSHHFSAGYDSSVHVHRDRYNDGYLPDREIRYWSVDPMRVLSFVKELFAVYKIEQNDSCGNHIHIRFSDGFQWQLLTYRKCWQRFIATYKEHFADNPKYLKRCTNQHCSSAYNEGMMLQQLNMGFKHCSRKSAINFNSLKAKQNTIELRILPHAENYPEYKKAFTFVVGTFIEIVTEEITNKRRHGVLKDIPKTMPRRQSLANLAWGKAIYRHNPGKMPHVISSKRFGETQNQQISREEKPCAKSLSSKSASVIGKRYVTCSQVKAIRTRTVRGSR